MEDERLCALVLIGVRPDGSKEVIALEDGYRESAESWRAVLRDLKRRGMRAPVLAIGDGALGFWAAVREVWPETAEQRCWVHRIANVLDKLPKSLQPRAKQALHAMLYAETRTVCEREIRRFTAEYGAKYPKAVAALTTDQERLLTLFDYPAEHWKHLRTTNPIESTFATVRLRERVTKGAGSRTAGLTMAFKLLEAAQAHWRRLDGADLIPLVRAGVRFVDGRRVSSGRRSGRRAPPDLTQSTTLDNSSHVAAGLVCVVVGAVAMLSPKRPGHHLTAGTLYYWSLVVVSLSMTALSIMRWPADTQLLVLGILSLGAGAIGRTARRRRCRGWLRIHIVGMGLSYILLLTAFYVDNGPSLPLWRSLPALAYWLGPSIVGLPILVRALLRHPLTGRRRSA